MRWSIYTYAADKLLEGVCINAYMQSNGNHALPFPGTEAQKAQPER